LIHGCRAWLPRLAAHLGGLLRHPGAMRGATDYGAMAAWAKQRAVINDLRCDVLA
jgi:hypothetical protein